MQTFPPENIFLISHAFSAEAISRRNDWMFGRQLKVFFAQQLSDYNPAAAVFFFFLTKCAPGAFNLTLQSSSQEGLFCVHQDRIYSHKHSFMSRV